MPITDHSSPDHEATTRVGPPTQVLPVNQHPLDSSVQVPADSAVQRSGSVVPIDPGSSGSIPGSSGTGSTPGDPESTGQPETDASGHVSEAPSTTPKRRWGRIGGDLGDMSSVRSGRARMFRTIQILFALFILIYLVLPQLSAVREVCVALAT